MTETAHQVSPVLLPKTSPPSWHVNQRPHAVTPPSMALQAEGSLPAVGLIGQIAGHAALTSARATRCARVKNLFVRRPAARGSAPRSANSRGDGCGLGFDEIFLGVTDNPAAIPMYIVSTSPVSIAAR